VVISGESRALLCEFSLVFQDQSQY